MEENKTQNAALMTTSKDDNGVTHLTYIPLNIDSSIVEFFLKNGSCTNKRAIDFEIEEDKDEYWEGLWEYLLSNDEPTQEQE